MTTQKPAKKKFYTATDKKTLTAAERRYRAAVSKLRSIPRNTIPKETQVELAHMINDIESYGFNFFPNHYIFESIIKLESLAAKITTR